MAAVRVYRLRWHYKETVTAGGAFVSNNNPDSLGFFVAADLPTAVGLIPAVAAPGGASNTNTVVLDEATDAIPAGVTSA